MQDPSWPCDKDSHVHFFELIQKQSNNKPSGKKACAREMKSVNCRAVIDLQNAARWHFGVCEGKHSQN